jgi:hypothetical protein
MPARSAGRGTGASALTLAPYDIRPLPLELVVLLSDSLPFSADGCLAYNRLSLTPLLYPPFLPRRTPQASMLK